MRVRLARAHTQNTHTCAHTGIHILKYRNVEKGEWGRWPSFCAHNPSNRDHWKDYKFVFLTKFVLSVWCRPSVSCICGTQSHSDLWLQRRELTNHLYIISISVPPGDWGGMDTKRYLSKKTDSFLIGFLSLRAPQGLCKLGKSQPDSSCQFPSFLSVSFRSVCIWL